MRGRLARFAVLTLFLSALSAVLDAAPARATTVSTVDFICPLCQTHFRQQMTTSSTSWGQRLDLLPVGNASYPWPMAKCPKCNLVLYKERFTRREIEGLRSFVFSDEYRALSPRSSPYLLARTRERLGAKDLELAHLFLSAAWASTEHSADWSASVTESVRHFDAFLRAAKQKDREWATAALVRGELLRRLARFPEAEAHFRDLKEKSAFLRANFADFLEQELQLIAARDSDPHNRGEPSPARLRELALSIIDKAPGAAALAREYQIEGARVSMGDDNIRPSWLHVDRVVPRDAPFALEARLSMGRENDFSIQLDLNPFLDTYRQLRTAASRHRWLTEWLRAGPQRRAVVNLTRWNAQNSLGSSMEWAALFPKLRRPGEPPAVGGKTERRYEVELRCGDKLGARLQMTIEDRPVLITEIEGCNGTSHFLDKQQPFARKLDWLQYLTRDYLVVEADGRFVRVSDRAAVACPPGLCTEPCNPSQTGCTGAFVFECYLGSISLYDPSEGGQKPYTCGALPDGKMGPLGLAGASCDPLLVPEDHPVFCAPGLSCVQGTCKPAQSGAAASQPGTTPGTVHRTRRRRVVRGSASFVAVPASKSASR